MPVPLVVLLALGAAPVSCDTAQVAWVSGSLRIAGTVFQPPEATRAPAMLLIHGSGRVGRETMTWIAEWLCYRGIAALAYDKRGVGASEGADSAWRYFSIDDLAQDATRGLALLRTLPGIDSSRLGLFGASQGGWVALRAAELDQRVALLVTISASVSTIAEDNVFERAARLRHECFTPAEIDTVRRLHLLDNAVTRRGLGFDELARALTPHSAARWLPRVYPAGLLPADAPYRRWYRSVMDFDAPSILARLAIPSLWLYGDPELDRFAPVALSLERLRPLQQLGRPITLHSFAGADHNLRLANGSDAPFWAPLETWLADVTGTP